MGWTKGMEKWDVWWLIRKIGMVSEFFRVYVGKPAGVDGLDGLDGLDGRSVGSFAGLAMWFPESSG